MQGAVALLAAAIGSAGCGGTRPGTGVECSATEDCPQGECVAGVCQRPDAGDDPAADVPALDTLAEVEAGETGSLLGFGEACTTDNECASNWCIEGHAGRVCTRLCDGECEEEGWSCRLLTNSGGDVTRLCVPDRDVQCRPCETSADCAGFDSACLDFDNGRYCASACADRATCAPGYLCAPTPVDDGGSTVVRELCVPEGGVCNPVYLDATTVTGGATTATGRLYRLVGRVVSMPTTSTGSRFRLSGGL